MEFGTPEQKARFLPRMAAGEEMWAQAWSEPQAGSDLAALRATALRDGDEYVLRGHKIWSSRAAYADWGFGMFRTDPASERHRGISFILFPLDLPGVRVRGIPQIHGETGFAEIFFEDARVPVANRLGAEGAGWQIAMATAGFERGLMLRSPARFQATAQRLVELYRQHAAELDPAIAGQVAQAWMDAQAYALNTYMTASRLIAGGTIGVEASLNKIFWSELDLAMHDCAMRILGCARAAAAAGARRRGRRRLARGLHVLARGPDLRRHERDPAQHHRGAADEAAAGLRGGRGFHLQRRATDDGGLDARAAGRCLLARGTARRGGGSRRRRAPRAGSVTASSGCRDCSRRSRLAGWDSRTSTSC